MANIINQKDCLTTRKNLGFSDCVIEFGIVDGFILTPKGWSLDLTSLTFNKEYVNDQIQQVTYLIRSSGSVTKLQKYLYLSPTQCNFGER